MPGPASSTARYDRERVDHLLDQLGALRVGVEGTVALLVETPEPGRHVTREAVTAVPGKGFAGDHPRKSFYKGRLVPGREVSAVSLEVLRVLGVAPVVVGDNLITRGVDLARLEPGDRVGVGEVLLVRSEQDHRPCTVFRDRTSPEAFAVVSRDRHRGALFVVERGGTIHRGDAIRILD